MPAQRIEIAVQTEDPACPTRETRRLVGPPAGQKLMAAAKIEPVPTLRNEIGQHVHERVLVITDARRDAAPERVRHSHQRVAHAGPPFDGVRVSA